MRQLCGQNTAIPPKTGERGAGRLTVRTLPDIEMAIAQSRQTRCKRGHEFTPKNTLLQAGRRICRACRALLASKYRASNPEKGRAACRASNMRGHCSACGLPCSIRAEYCLLCWSFARMLTGVQRPSTQEHLIAAQTISSNPKDLRRYQCLIQSKKHLRKLQETTNRTGRLDLTAALALLRETASVLREA